MTSDPIISVATLCYNNSENVIKTLGLIRSQTYQNVDHIIVDDCSQDASSSKIRKWIEENKYSCRFIQNETNIGICKTLNKILPLAKGDLFAINCDDFWEPFHLENSLNILRKSGADVIYSSTKVYRSNGEFICFLEDTLLNSGYVRYKELFNSNEPYFLISNNMAVDALFYCNYLHLISLLVPIKFLRSRGGFNEKLPFEDYDMNFNICSTLKVCFNKSFTTTYYKYEKSYTMNPAMQVKLFWGVIYTLINHKHLIKYDDTYKKVQSSINDNCYEILRLEPQYFFQIISVYKKAFPSIPLFRIVYLFSKRLVINTKIKFFNFLFIKSKVISV